MRRVARKMIPRDHRSVARVVTFVIAVGVAYAAWSYKNDLNVRRPIVLRLPTPRSSRSRAPAARVVWVMVDGLRLDASREMKALNELRAKGEDVWARAEFPTYSGPNLVAQASGIEPAASGVFSNEYPGEVALDSVFRRARAAGFRTAVLTTDMDPSLSWLYASWIDETEVDDPDMLPPLTELVFVHIGYVDATAHALGSASPEYRAAVARADDAIGRIARTLDPTREALIVTSDHGHLDEGGHGGTERAVVRIPIVIWGAGAGRGTRAGRGRDVGPTIASLLGIGPLSHATGRPLVRGDVVASRQRAAARAAVRSAGTLEVVHVRAAIPIAVVALLMLSRGSRLAMRPLMTSPTYGLVFAGLLVATHTLSFSVSNDSALFGARLTTLSTLAVLAQLRVGGRSSLVPAALITSLAVLGTSVVAAHQPLSPADGMLRFLPIPALTALAFVCLATAAIGTRDEAPVRASPPGLAAEPRPDRAATSVLVFEPGLVEHARPALGAAGRPQYTARVGRPPCMEDPCRTIVSAMSLSPGSQACQRS